MRRKGGDLLIEAVRALRAEDSLPIVELHLVTGAEVSEEPGVFVHRGLTANSHRLIEQYHLADIFCLPTLGDCLPMVLAEAAAAGLPLVSTDVGAIHEIVVPGVTGALVPPGDLQRSSTPSDTSWPIPPDAVNRPRQPALSLFGARRSGQRSRIATLLRERRVDRCLTMRLARLSYVEHPLDHPGSFGSPSTHRLTSAFDWIRGIRSKAIEIVVGRHKLRRFDIVGRCSRVRSDRIIIQDDGWMNRDSTRFTCNFAPIELHCAERHVDRGLRTGMNSGSLIEATGRITIGDHVDIGPYCPSPTRPGRPRGVIDHAPITIDQGV